MGANSPEKPRPNQFQAGTALMFPKKIPYRAGPSVFTTSTPSFLKNFTWERFNKNPDLYRKQLTGIINAQLRQVDATVGLLRYASPELHQLQRELGLLHIKCHTFYERYIFIRCLRENAGDILSSFDLSTGKSVEEIVSKVPPSLRDSLRLYQTRWRNSISSSRWQKDLTSANEELAAVREHLERCERELERKKTHLEMYRKIDAIKDEFVGLSDENKLKKVESVLGVKAPPLLAKEDNLAMRKRSFSEGSASVSSEDDSSWDELWSGAHFAALGNQEKKQT
ncbi:hypothetical protein Y032_0008g104 [Ancylostoma ceylanicum]|uniref:Uncharacterized protein n=1 Tax=Ancylostoma ceylanicum TaxID=53326 RepID=A0A016VLM1_9BILA|nr:hypothetical protein Y032_0008g104 [Ancylostoma ceylanicum]